MRNFSAFFSKLNKRANAEKLTMGQLIYQDIKRELFFLEKRPSPSSLLLFFLLENEPQMSSWVNGMIEVVASKRNCLKNYVSLKRAAVSVWLSAGSTSTGEVAWRGKITTIYGFFNWIWLRVFFSFCKKYHLISLSEFPRNNWERYRGARSRSKKYYQETFIIRNPYHEIRGRTHKKFFREQKGVPLLFPLE